MRVGGTHVDYFVVVEGTHTFSGKRKPLHFADSEKRFAPWAHQIRHIVVEPQPDRGDRWDAEIYQRNSIVRGLADADPDDVVIIADADELIDPSVLTTLRHRVDELTALEMPSTFYRANWVLPLGQFAGAARAIRAGDLTDPHHQRNHTAPRATIASAGCHFTYLLETDGVRRKYESYAHAEMDTDTARSVDHIRRSQRLGVDLFSGALASVQAPAELSGLQLELLRIRPDLFDFQKLPRFGKRILYKWFAAWRRSQAPDSIKVLDLDVNYERRRLAVARHAATALGIELLWRRPVAPLRWLMRRLNGHDQTPGVIGDALLADAGAQGVSAQSSSSLKP